MEIAADEGFMPRKDIFGRKSFGDKLTKIVRALEIPSVLLLDAPWGTGKTTTTAIAIAIPIIAVAARWNHRVDALQNRLIPRQPA